MTPDCSISTTVHSSSAAAAIPAARAAAAARAAYHPQLCQQPEEPADDRPVAELRHVAVSGAPTADSNVRRRRIEQPCRDSTPELVRQPGAVATDPPRHPRRRRGRGHEPPNPGGPDEGAAAEEAVA